MSSLEMRATISTTGTGGSSPSGSGICSDSGRDSARYPTLLLKFGICAVPWSKNQGHEAGTLEMAVALLWHIMPLGD